MGIGVDTRALRRGGQHLVKSVVVKIRKRVVPGAVIGIGKGPAVVLPLQDLLLFLKGHLRLCGRLLIVDHLRLAGEAAARKGGAQKARGQYQRKNSPVFHEILLLFSTRNTGIRFLPKGLMALPEGNPVTQKLQIVTTWSFVTLERIMGIEPTLSAWEADVLPMNYIRKCGHYSTVGREFQSLFFRQGPRPGLNRRCWRRQRRRWPRRSRWPVPWPGPSVRPRLPRSPAHSCRPR